MRVAIFETEHFEAAYPLIRLFDTGENEIFIFSYPSAYRQLQFLLCDTADKYHWIVKKQSQSKISFINIIYKEVKQNKIELLFLNTISDNFIFYSLLMRRLKNVRVILTLHMINNLFETKWKLSLRRLIRNIGKKMLVKSIKEFNVLSETMLPQLREKLPSSKTIHCIPGAIFENSSLQKNPPELSTPIRIVIPGSIDSKRRNYDSAFELLHLANNENIIIEVIFLGRFHGDYGKKILLKCKNWNLANTNLKFYEEGTIDQQEFDEILQNADFIFTPSVINTIIDDDVKEVYGETISSGNVSDVIRHAKPFIIPRQLQIDHYLEKSCIRYSQVEDILNILVSFRNNPALYGEITNSALTSSQNYSIEKVVARNKSIFAR